MHRAACSPLSRRKKILAAVAAFSVSSTVLFGGSLALLTDAATTEEQTLVAGTVDIELNSDNLSAPFEQDIKPMAAGDTFSRYVTLKNAGNLGVTNLSISQENGGGPIINGEYGVTVAVDACTEAWENGTCAGTEYQALPETPPAGWEGFMFLNLPELAPADSWYFRFKTSLPEDAPNSYQNEASWLRYTFNGVQPGGKDYKNDGTVETVDQDGRVDASDLTFSILEDGSIQLSWNPVAGATSYRIERSSDPEAGDNKLIVYGDRTSVTDKSVEPNTVYYYRVVTVGATAQDATPGDWVPVGTWMDMDYSPALQLEDTSEGATISWDAVSTATYYKLERTRGETAPAPTQARMARSAAPAWETVAEGSRLTTVNDTDTTPGARYWYRLTLTGFYGEQIFSVPTKFEEPLSTPVLTLDQPELASVELSWTAVEGVDSYEVRRLSGDEDGVVATTEATSYSETLEPKREYRYVVTAVSADGVRASSETMGVSTDPNSPALSLVPTAHSVTATWSPVEGAKSYNLHYSTQENLVPTFKTATQGTSVTIPALDSNRTYYVFVEAVGEGWRALSVVKATTTTPSVPVVTLGEVGARSATLSWVTQKLADPTYVLDVTGGGATRTVSAGDATTLTVDKLTPNTTYSIVVKVLGKSSIVQSLPVEFTTDAAGAVLEAKPATGEKVDLSWNAVGGATFKLERSLTKNFAVPMTVYEGTSTSAADTDLTPGTVYYYRLTTQVGTENYTSEASATTKLAAITLSGAYVAPAVELYWDQLKGAVSYRLTRKAGSSDAEVLYNGTNFSYRDEAMATGQTYTYEVVARGADGATVTATQSVLAPLAIPELTAQSVDGQHTTLTWDAVDNAKSYTLERSLTPNFNKLTKLYQGELLSYEDRSVEPETTYYYRLKAEALEEEASALSPVVEQASGLPLVDFTVAPHSPTSLLVQWTAPEPLTTLTLEQYSEKGGELLEEFEVSGEGQAVVEGIRPGSAYYYRLVSTTEAGDFYLSGLRQATLPLPAFSDLPAVSSIAFNRATISWPAVAGANTYELQLSVDEGDTWTTYPETSATSFTPVNLEASTSYMVRVKAKTSLSSETAISAPLPFHTAIAGSSLVVSDVAPTKVTLNWSPVAKSSYQLLRSTSADFSDAILVSSFENSTTSYADSSVVPGERYYYRIVATDGFGQTSQAQVSTLTGLATPVLNATAASDVITLSWSSVAGASNYSLRRDGVEIYNGPATSFTDSSRALGEKFVYTVVATSAKNATATSTPVTAYTSPGDFTFTGSATSPFTVNLSWGVGAGVKTIALQRATTPDFQAATTLKTGEGGGAFVDETVAENTAYYYRLAVTANSGQVTYKGPLTITTPHNRVVISVTPASGTTMAVSWPEITTATEYVVFRGTSASTATTEVGRTAEENFLDGGLTPGRQYYYKVEARDSAGGQAAQASAAVAGVTPLEVSANITEIAPSSVEGSLFETQKFTWETVPGATGYYLQYREAGSSGWSATSTYGSTSVTLTNVFRELTSYEVRVVAVPQAGSTTTGPESTFTAGLNPVSAPAADVSASRPITVYWGPKSTSITKHEIERATQADFSDATVVGQATATSSAFMDTTTEPGTGYYYRVKSYGAKGGVTDEATSQATPISYSGLDQPDAPSVVNVNPTTQTVTWAPVAGATSAWLYYTPAGGTKTLAWSGDATTTSFTVDSLTPEKSYTWSVDAAGPNNLSISGQTTTLATQWGAPVVIGGSVTASSYRLSWPKVTNTEYAMQRSLDEDFSTVETVATLSADSTTYNYTGLQPGTKYYFRIQSRNVSTGEYNTSNVFSAVTLFASASTITGSSAAEVTPATASEGGVLTFNHSAVQNADTYTVQLALDGATTPLEEKVSDGDSVTFTGLELNRKYIARVVATNAAGATITGDWSSAISTKTAPPTLALDESKPLTTVAIPFTVTNPTNVATSYTITAYRDSALTIPHATKDIVADPGATSSELSGNFRDSTTYYVVAAATNSGDSSAAVEAAIPGKLTITDSTASPISISNYNSTRTITWSKDPAAVSYDVRTYNWTVNSSPIWSSNVSASTFTYSRTASYNGITAMGVRPVYADGSTGEWVESYWKPSGISSQSTNRCRAEDLSSTTVGIYCSSTSPVSGNDMRIGTKNGRIVAFNYSSDGKGINPGRNANNVLVHTISTSYFQMGEWDYFYGDPNGMLLSFKYFRE